MLKMFLPIFFSKLRKKTTFFFKKTKFKLKNNKLDSKSKRLRNKSQKNKFYLGNLKSNNFI